MATEESTQPVDPNTIEGVKSNYTPEEWEQLKAAPMLVALGVMFADLSGPIGLAQELGRAATLLTNAAEAESPNALVQAVAAEAVKGQDKDGSGQSGQAGQAGQTGETASDPTQDFRGKQPEEATSMVLERLRFVDSLLKEKSASDDRTAFRAFLLDLGRQVAAAAKEGTVFGFGGTSVTAKEQAALEQIAAALGGEAAPPTSGF